MSWISIKDQKPEPKEKVLVATRFGSVNYGFIETNGHFVTANSELYDSWCWEPDVTHWMPLPDPPEYEEKQGNSTHKMMKCNVCIYSQLIVFPEGPKFSCGLPQHDAIKCWNDGGSKFAAGSWGKQLCGICSTITHPIWKDGGQDEQDR